MALLNISLVTQALTTLISEYFRASPAWGATAPTVSPQPPNLLTGDSIGLYLYHIAEDAHYKNLPALGNDTPPVRYTPMGLNLFYQLTARSTSEDSLLEQQMMGIAIKALRDYPIIDDATAIDGTSIYPADLQGDNNRLRIVLQPVAHHDAVSYWTAGSSPLRLAAYYQVSVALLEPEESKSRAGRVLAYGIQTFVNGAPRIDSSQSTMSFLIPGTLATQNLTLQPAQAPSVKTGLPPNDPAIEKSRIKFKGAGFTGERTSLLLCHQRWSDPVDVTASWSLAATAIELSSVAQEKANGNDVIPGVYAVIAKVTRKLATPSGTQDIEHRSNACPFTITPRIDSVAPPDAVHKVVITGYLFRHADIPTGGVQVYVGQIRLALSSGGPLASGEFTIDSTSQITVQLPTTLEPGKNYPLRIFVNGAESSPQWIKMP